MHETILISFDTSKRPDKFAPSHVVPPPSQRAVRVYVPTYRRPALLRRALESLRAQTLSHWVCEVHNDDPKDAFPGELVRNLDDPRIILHQHNRNLGAEETFNLFYRPTQEDYYSLLEDDNWWEPDFLETMLREMQVHPNITMAWCNQRIWQELPDGSWRDTGRLVGPTEPTTPRMVTFGNTRQIIGALHSNGAMLLRSRPGQIYATPSGWPFAAIEPLRERMIAHPLLYVSTPLAAFSITRKTARNGDRIRWATAQTMLAATFIKHANLRELGTFGPSRRRSRRPSSAD